MNAGSKEIRPMHIELRVAPDLPAGALAACTYDPNDDDVRSILADACEALEGHAEFLIAGFGQDRWPVDLRTDLAVFLEQMPDALRAVRSGEEAEIDLYEQGIERTLELQPRGAGYAVRCVSRTDWQPVPEVDAFEGRAIETMLLGVRDAFLQALARLAPELRTHPWIVEWQAAE
ncbi:hypothetical protein [Variovorax sp.]|jgi:hypothetical protein|uniref:hypothetical protein n=1 Tax=Variovorax sp. TaxID=1871043 RepID=UPI0037DA55A5